LFILCTGHNEFLEDRTYGHIKNTPLWVRSSLELACRLRLFNALHQAWLSLQVLLPAKTDADRAPTRLEEEVDAWLDYAGGIKVYHRDERWRSGVIQHFEFNLRRLTGLAQEARVPIIFIRPPSNMRDCPPFKSQHRSGLAEADLAAWTTLVTKARTQVEANPAKAVELFRQALAIDDAYALTHFEIARAYDHLGLLPEAKKAYLRARELDVCPLRILTPMEEALERVARDTATPLVDAQRLLEQRTTGGIPGNDWLLDHIHPSIPGHQLIAEALFNIMEQQGWVQPQATWKQRRDAAYAGHMNSLPDSYLEEGERALEGLRAWTEGRASGPPVEYRLLRQDP
jgi:tetratricopeptide (TPR) repeat protein